MKELKRAIFTTSLKDLQLNEIGRTNYTFKTVGAAFWALKQKDFRSALQDIVMEVAFSYFWFECHFVVIIYKLSL